MRRMGFVACGLLVTACAQPLIDDLYTPEEWEAVKKSFVVDADLLKAHTCSPAAAVHLQTSQLPTEENCEAYAKLGQEVFFDPTLSGAILFDDPYGVGHRGDINRVSCASCHDPTHFYIDTRSQPSNVSFGTGFDDPMLGPQKYTTHNALSLVNVILKDIYAADQGQPAFTWLGAADYSTTVFEQLALKKAMNGCDPDGSTGPSLASPAGCAKNVGNAVRRYHAARYASLFGLDHLINDDNDTVMKNTEVALDLYERRLVSVDSRFDAYIAGDDSALTTGEQHGFELFVGKAVCVECHNGPALTDFSFHSNGIEQSGPNVLLPDDPGREKSTNNPDDYGLFMTPSLRNVAMTAPYMHSGQKADLDAVTMFYWTGGGSVPTKSVEIEALTDLSLDDVGDLTAFLRTLTGSAPDAKFGTGNPTW